MKLIDKDDKKLLFEKFPFSKQSVLNADCVQKLWTMDWHSSVRTNHTTLNNEVRNEDE